MKKLLVVSLLSVSMMGLGSSAFAQGIPTFDGSTLIQMKQQVDSMKQQLEEARKSYESTVGYRGFGDLLRDPSISKFLPDDMSEVLSGINKGGYEGISEALDAILKEEQLSGDIETDQTAVLEREQKLNAAHKAIGKEAYEGAGKRLEVIEGLIDEIANTEDPKESQELQARLTGEQALVNNELQKIQILQQLVAAERELIEIQKDEAVRQEFSSDKKGMPKIR